MAPSPGRRKDELGDEYLSRAAPELHACLSPSPHVGRAPAPSRGEISTMTVGLSSRCPDVEGGVIYQPRFSRSQTAQPVGPVTVHLVPWLHLGYVRKPGLVGFGSQYDPAWRCCYMTTSDTHLTMEQVQGRLNQREVPWLASRVSDDDLAGCLHADRPLSDRIQHWKIGDEGIQDHCRSDLGGSTT